MFACLPPPPVIDDLKLTHIIRKAFARCVSQELSEAPTPPLPARLPKQRPRLLIYSKSLKSPYYCSSSSPSPYLSPHLSSHPPIPTQKKKTKTNQQGVTSPCRRVSERGDALTSVDAMVSRFWRIKSIPDERLETNTADVSFHQRHPRTEAGRILPLRADAFTRLKNKKKAGETFFWAVKRTCA